jgi:hypothetical protein
MSSEKDTFAAIDTLVDEYRTRCLWSLRPDYYPATLDERLSVLERIERCADLAGYQRAFMLRQWLSQNSSEQSATS